MDFIRLKRLTGMTVIVLVTVCFTFYFYILFSAVVIFCDLLAGTDKI